jgi:hypothetical protein
MSVMLKRSGWIFNQLGLQPLSINQLGAVEPAGSQGLSWVLITDGETHWPQHMAFPFDLATEALLPSGFDESRMDFFAQALVKAGCDSNSSQKQTGTTIQCS